MEDSSDNTQEINNINLLIDAEIKAENGSINKGWTLAGAITSIVALIWLLSNTLSGQKTINTNIYQLLILATFTFTIVISLIKSITNNADENNKNTIKFSTAKDQLGSKRLKIIMTLTLFSSNLYFINELYSSSNELFTQVAYFTTTFHIALNFFGLLLSFSNFRSYKMKERGKFPIRNKAYIFYIIAFILLSVHVYIIINMVIYIKDNLNLLKHDYQVAGIVFLIYILAIYISTQLSSKPILDRMSQIRRDLMLGEISVKDARNQIKNSLEGLSIEEVLSEKISSIESSFEKFNERLNKIDLEVKSLLCIENPDGINISINEVAQNIIINSFTKKLQDLAIFMEEEIEFKAKRLKMEESVLLRLTLNQGKLGATKLLRQKIEELASGYNASVLFAFDTVKNKINSGVSTSMINKLNLVDNIEFSTIDGKPS